MHDLAHELVHGSGVMKGWEGCSTRQGADGTLARMEERIRKSISEALGEMGAGKTMFVVERPSDLAYGDYATNAALAAAKNLGRNPRELADELSRALKGALGAAVERG